ncbi:MAG: ATP-binding protein, partial [Desulfatitalea sp.]|nr:ATP-binding protein [Desulfatitalea sp.]
IQAVRARLAGLGDDPAVDYQPRIRVATATDASDIILTIEDNGIGMDPPTLERAFEPLFTTRARGTGIGLAIVHKIVKEHNGRIALESTAGQGTKATIHLPQNRSDT